MARLRRGKAPWLAAAAIAFGRADGKGAGPLSQRPSEPSVEAAGNKADRDRPSIAEEVLAKAEAAIDRLAAEYPRHARRDIENMLEHAQQMALETVDRAHHYNEILRIAHDVRGQGLLFGYPFVTRYASSLCRATRLLAADDRAILDIVRAHLAALEAILDYGRAGPEDVTALRIAGGLELLVSSRVDR
jgi:hypothetical protein